MASAARSTAPGGPRRLTDFGEVGAHVRRFRLLSLDAERAATTSVATRSGVKSDWMSSGTARFSAMRLTMLKNLVRTSGLARSGGERGDAVDDDHRDVEEGGFDGGGAAGDDGGVGGGEGVVGLVRRRRGAESFPCPALAERGGEDCSSWPAGAAATTNWCGGSALWMRRQASRSTGGAGEVRRSGCREEPRRAVLRDGSW